MLFITKHMIHTKTNLYCVILCDVDDKNVMFASELNVLY